MRAFERVLRLHALGHVAQNHGIKVTASHARARDGGLDREFAAVTAQPREHVLRTVVPRCSTGCAERVNVAPVRKPVTIRYQHVERLPHGFLTLAQEYAL